MRAFVAIELPEETHAVLAAARAAFVEAAPDWAGEKWVRRENLHVTVRFLADLDDREADAATEALADAAASCAPFEMHPAGIRAVPSARRASMLWASYTACDAASSIAVAVEDALALFDPTDDVKPFKPHVTLVRARRSKHVPQGALDAARAAVSNLLSPVSVLSVTLYSSTLTPSGPEYRRVAVLPLRRA